jgi:hypothetical protein
MTSLITFEINRYISCWLSQQGCEKMVKQKIEKMESGNKNEEMEENRSLLVGYVRKSNAGGALKISIDICHQRWSNICSIGHLSKRIKPCY